MRERGWTVAASVLALGCGRVGFDRSTDGGAGDDGGVTDGLTVDLPANALTLTFGERPTADVQGVTFDTFISNEAGEPTLNYGGTDELRSELDVNERILLRFDTSAIPTTATVLQARIALEITQTDPAATWSLRRVLEPWTEGTVDGTAGTANYTQRTAGTAWTTAGCGEPGSATPSFATVTDIQLGTATLGLLEPTVQMWIATPAENHGLVFYNTFTESVRFASSEHGTASLRPLLTITYVP